MYVPSFPGQGAVYSVIVQQTGVNSYVQKAAYVSSSSYSCTFDVNGPGQYCYDLGLYTVFERFLVLVALLPPVFQMNGEGTVFTGVCLLTGGGGTPSPSHNTSTHWSHVLYGGVPQCLVPCPFPGATPHPVPNRGYPTHSLMVGVPQPGQDGDTPHQDRIGVAPWDWIEQQSEYLLRGRRYAS